MSRLPDVGPLGLILAGGAGRRMGGVDKALLRLGARPLLDLVLDRFSPQVSDLALSANGDAARFSHWGLPVLADDLPSCGPLSGVLAGLAWATARGGRCLVTVPVDAPLLPQDLVPRLMLAAAASGSILPAVARTDRGLHPTFALWPVDLAADLAAFLASGASPRLRDFAARHGAVFADFADEAEFANLNTPQDAAALRGSPDAG